MHFTKPKLEVIALDVQDIIRTSASAGVEGCKNYAGDAQLCPDEVDDGEGGFIHDVNWNE